MKLRPCSALLLAALFCAGGAHASRQTPAPASIPTRAHHFGVIGHTFAGGASEAQLEKALANIRKAPLAFVVATGVKGVAEPCTDELYMHRRDMLDSAKRPVIVVPAASDWSYCKNAAGRLVSIERLNRLRELLYEEPDALGTRALMLARQSANAKFRSYAENAYWIMGDVLYATVNLPSNNNNYRSEAGRNSEYEDRTVADRFWLTRLFAQAKHKQLTGVVLFSEGNVNILKEEPGLLARLGRSNQTPQDGYAAARRQIVALAKKFEGKVLLIDTAPVSNGVEPAIAWRENVGHVSVGSRVMQVDVTPGAEHMFRIDER
ncbi:hypothetical protein [Massilia sp. TSP1-1-2]|uniref:hypothetical protein n=1 Tax=Massilia sp. TSP1-1-2 TaxID=2804649 RepID=UPI003CF4ED75